MNNIINYLQTHNQKSISSANVNGAHGIKCAASTTKHLVRQKTLERSFLLPISSFISPIQFTMEKKRFYFNGVNPTQEHSENYIWVGKKIVLNINLVDPLHNYCHLKAHWLNLQFLNRKNNVTHNLHQSSYKIMQV